jgi:hypothetical protein
MNGAFARILAPWRRRRPGPVGRAGDGASRIVVLAARPGRAAERESAHLAYPRAERLPLALVPSWNACLGHMRLGPAVYAAPLTDRRDL